MVSWFRAAALSCLLLLAGLAAGSAEDRQATPGGVAPPPPAAESIDTAQLMIPGPLKEMTLGEPTAPVKVVEYASMTCPHCARFANETFDAFKAKYIDTGKVFFVFREFPLDQLALVAIMAARCAPEDKFFEIVAKLFREQAEWAFVDNPAPPLMAKLAEEGLSNDAFTTCIADKQLAENVVSVEKRGEETFGVKGTPTFFFNGQKHTGELTMAEVDAMMEPLLKP